MVAMTRDARGKELGNQEYRRIVSLVPSWTESLFAMAAGDRVIAVTDYCSEPRDAITNISRIGGTKNPRIEQILSLHPDLIVANVEENRRADVERLEENGVPAFVTDARTVEQGIRELQSLGQLVGARDLESILLPIEREYALAVASRGQGRCPRVFVAIWRDPWMTANGNTFVNDIVELSGGENIFRDRERLFPLAADLGFQDPRPKVSANDVRYPRVSVDEVIRRAPEVVLLPDEPYPFAQKDADQWRQHKDIPAVQQDRVLLVDGKLLSWYGVRMGSSLRVMRRILNGQQESESG
jgi:ABC-type Fe3+-hydroxamate transport system substrate-binding protein